jgi:hypothetical protein
MAEFRNFAVPLYQEHMHVDTTLGEQLQVNINVTFHALTCNQAHLDVMDIAGYNQLNVEHDMVKQRLSPAGIPIGTTGVEIIGEVIALSRVLCCQSYCYFNVMFVTVTVSTLTFRVI